MTRSATIKNKLSSPLMPGLYLVATPIGNLGDITLRAIETLKSADLILCEDTRVTRTLLAHYQIDRPTRVYNDQSEGRDHQGVVDQIAAGRVVAIVSDAGSPLISDPGYQLVRAVQAAGLRVVTVPGASSVISAVQLSGLPSDAFYFAGFLPNRSAERQRRLRELMSIPATLIFFERAERVMAFLEDAITVLGDRDVAVVREITKMFEEVRRENISNIKKSIQDKPLKGEIVVLIDRGPGLVMVDDVTIIKELRARIAKGDSRRDAVDTVAATLGVVRRRVYSLAVEI